MSRVFSWKLDDYKYGYIIPPKQNGSHISERITNEAILSKIAETVKNLDKSTYKKMFDELNEEVFDMFHVTIKGNIDDFYGNDNIDNSYIILTGKDGSNSNTMLNNEDLKKIEKAVTDRVNLAISEIEASEKSLKSWVVDKTNSSALSSITITQECIESMNEKTQNLAEKLENAEKSIKIAASLFDFNDRGITREKLIGAIANSNSALTLASVAKSIADDSIKEIKDVSKELSKLEKEQASLKGEIRVYNDTMLTNIGKVRQKINEIQEEFEEVKLMPQLQTESSETKSILGSVVKSRKRNENSPNSIITNVVQNGDGTYTSLVKIGDENYFINVLPSGETLTDKNAKNGLTLSKNGFRYVNGNSEILISDGAIKLSNKNGNGSIEINDDGVFINGKKSE